jgi:hypothetical protein
MKCELRPHEGTADVRYGMAREEVRRLLGPASYADPKKDFFAGAALHVHYDDAGCAELIVVASATGGEGIFDGVDLLGVDAEKALAVVRRFSTVDQQHAEYPMTCVFPELDLNLWRSCLPEDVTDGSEGRRFEAVAIGVLGYFSR